MSSEQPNLADGISPNFGIAQGDSNVCRLLTSLMCHWCLGLFVILLTVYISVHLQNNHVKSYVDELKEKFMTEKIRCQEPSNDNSHVDHKLLDGLNDGLNSVKKNEAGKIDDQHIRRLVRQVLDDFEVDRTGKVAVHHLHPDYNLRIPEDHNYGMTDFAMGVLGGQVLSTPNTITYGEEDDWNTPWNIRGPSTILDPSNLPGDCWAFVGKSGCVVIRLFAKIVVTNVTLEHISRDLSPTGVTSAPSIFSMVGLDDPEATTGHNFGSFVYNDNGPPLQTFPVRFTFVSPFEYLKVDFQDNHGHESFTCVYRIRIHGRRSDKPIRSERLPPLEVT